MTPAVYDVIVIGGGQSGLAVAYYLNRAGLNYVVLDASDNAGGSWQHYWHSLRLFSPAQWSSLPGVLMTGGPDYYPTRNETIDYLRKYEEKYNFTVQRGVTVIDVKKAGRLFDIVTSKGTYQSKAVVSATGSFTNPWMPELPGRDKFKGKVFHSSAYKRPDPFKSQQVAIVGEGNSGAQILAEVSKVAQTFWVTSKPPKFLPDEVDGRYLFDAATQMYEAKKAGKEFTPPSLGDVVMVPPVKEARKRGVLERAYPPIDHFTDLGIMLVNGQELLVDSVIFCTGFRPALDHLKSLALNVSAGKVATVATRSAEVPGLWLVGYGQWTGFASATLIGMGRSAKSTVEEIKEYV
ncbi:MULTISPECIES: ArsO family NAD(P)H-dependent flavin-containing monooxygenase [unclassified Imperialibacter]|uniref:ArsO family NAD(P)H-dependent flavin-containing monooxygenase n=1 Tax=unclassified Imperialibacter TaxID=2629706 RepID=UPI00125B78FD|nr:MULTISPECIES: ArsO family NAD(P)H-dependent flavin-containing monooxygenase [unclassified Imperialibacter]CAD5270809.1 Pyridine nucleotide-disulphide oxidoreductase [Imperialibacter sp. 89]CAD5298439.1 Pyridine nucleotide-disulphide oxidoreductase [Imperialibacter sp. 75]VVT34913.1 Pyridine nucleotide-disulphide oxidoreductase [Imperialibacter sp. EC-SDR9]